MQTLVERGCGLDVHQATVVACLLVNFTGGFDELSLVTSSGQMWKFFNGKSL
jgi:hypothetical protein